MMHQHDEWLKALEESHQETIFITSKDNMWTILEDVDFVLA